MSGWTAYDEYPDFHEEGTPAQLAARRTRRRRRHGKKQGFATPDMTFSAGDGLREDADARGHWLPPASATSLTLAQLGIHLPEKRIQRDAAMTLAQLGIDVSPPVLPVRTPVVTAGAATRRVVTAGDLGLFNFSTASPSLPGTAAPPPQPVPPPQAVPPPQRFPPTPQQLAPPRQQPQQQPAWQCADERPWERILSVPSPQLALNLNDALTMQHYQMVPPRPQNQQQHIQSAPWSADPDPAMRHWLCNGQYGSQPIYHTPLGGSSGIPLASAPPPPAAPAPAVAPLPGPLAPVAMAVKLKLEENDKLESLLEHLAAEAYQD